MNRTKCSNNFIERKNKTTFLKDAKIVRINNYKTILNREISFKKQISDKTSSTPKYLQTLMMFYLLSGYLILFVDGSFPKKRKKGNRKENKNKVSTLMKIGLKVRTITENIHKHC